MEVVRNANNNSEKAQANIKKAADAVADAIWFGAEPVDLMLEVHKALWWAVEDDKKSPERISLDQGVIVSST